MRQRVPSTDSDRSVAMTTIEYGITAVLVGVVLAAVLQIGGVHPKWLF
jgi:Flp pilus assembly pilin Flp